MTILSIETSCDETGIAILETTDANTVVLRGNALASQIDIHAQYGGVFPALAKRAHAEKIVPLLQNTLNEAGLLEAKTDESPIPDLSFLDEKESALKAHLIPFFAAYKKPAIDHIAVTTGPGLEPALWVGINAARALSIAWDIPIIPINHMEGHIVAAAIEKIGEHTYRFIDISFPTLSLLVSGGHTELVLVEKFGVYKKIGQTRDDAVGEAFDKVARVIGLPYPGGPAISKLAHEWRVATKESHAQNAFSLPRPMLHSGDFDFSFSGIKTAVLYAARDKGVLSDDDKKALACEFETATIEVLVKKTLAAASEYATPTIIVGGGVAANTYLREQLALTAGNTATLLFPESWLATDNAVMIGLAATTQVISRNKKTRNPNKLRADGNLSL